MLAVDIETSGDNCTPDSTGLDWTARILTIAVAYRDDGGCLFTKSYPVGMHDLFNPAASIPLVRFELERLINRHGPIVTHNGTFDLSYLLRDQFVDDCQLKNNILDTMLLARMTAPHDRVALAELVNEYRLKDHTDYLKWVAEKRQEGRSVNYEAMKKARKSLQKLSVDSVSHYNESDCVLTLLLAEKELELAKGLYEYDFLLQESDFVRVMAKIRVRGKAVCRDKLCNLIVTYRNYVKEAYREVLLSVKIGSPNNAKEILAYLDRQGAIVKKLTPKGERSTDEESLLDVIKRHPGQVADILTTVLSVRTVEKRLSTWLEPILDLHTAVDGRVHPNYSVAGAFTYRLTATQPGFQAMPKLDFWLPFVNADLSQAEYRLAAMYGKDSVLATQLQGGADFHLAAAKIMFPGLSPEETKAKRKIAKQGNFAALYFSGAATLAGSSGLSLREAEALLATHKRTFHQIHDFAKRAERKWTEQGKLRLLCGKYIHLPAFERSRSYKGFNNTVQGGVAGIAKIAMTELDRLGYPMVGQIHDSIEFDYWDRFDEAEVKHVMANSVPNFIQSRTDPRIEMVVDVDYK